MPQRIVQFLLSCTIIIGFGAQSSYAQCLTFDAFSQNRLSAIKISEIIAQTEYRLQYSLSIGDTSGIQKLATELVQTYAKPGLYENAAQILIQYGDYFKNESNDTISLDWLMLAARYLPVSLRPEAQKEYLLLAEQSDNEPCTIDAYQIVVNDYLNRGMIDKATLYIQSFNAWKAKAKPSTKLAYCMTPTQLRYAIAIPHQEMIDSLATVVRSEMLVLNKSENDQLLFVIYQLDSLPVDLTQEITKNLIQRENQILPIQVRTKLLSSLPMLDESGPNMSFSAQLESWQTLKDSQQLILDSIQNMLHDPVFLKKQLEAVKATIPEKSVPILIWLLGVISVVIIYFIVNKLANQKKQTTLSIESLDSQINETSKQIERLGTDIDKRVEDKIRLLNDELIEQKKLDNELRSAIKKAEEANYLKNSFLSNMSHEIRTPLNGILSFASLLETELALMENKELFDYANSIQQSGEKLLRLLNNIIDISRLQANDVVLKKEIINADQLISEVIESIQFRVADKGIKIVKQLSNSNRLEADYDMVKRILLELLDNSLKFTQKGYIKVSCHPLPEENSVEILVSDTGIGIDSTYLNSIFEPFRQESAGYSKHYQGAGLGLPLAKQMTQLMGGTFSIQSEKSIGTTVSITFPMASAHPENKDQVERKDAVIKETFIEFSPNKNIKVLIVEDDKMNMIVISKFIEPYFTVSKAYDGVEAIQIIKDAEQKDLHFDFMLFDINLPAPWDGLKLMHWIRKQYPHYQNIPFIAQTAYAMTGDRERFVDAGFNGYIAKPITKDKLLMIISSVMNFNEKS